MVSHRRQALLGAPADEVWRLVGDPRTYPDWWPVVVSVEGERLEEGLEYIQVSKGVGGELEGRFRIERLDEMRELHARCRLSGAFVHWRLTEAQDETFVEIELGMDPAGKPLRWRAFGKGYSRPLYRRWTDEALEALGGALAARRGGASSR